MQKKVGLTLGKFAPLHKWHEYLINMALSEVDELIVIIYNNFDLVNIPLKIRSKWVKKLYPQVSIIEWINNPDNIWTSNDIRRKHENYIKKLVWKKDIFAFYSSEFYWKYVSKALNTLNRIVDKDRIKVPISWTKLRTDPIKYKKFLHPIVYNELIQFYDNKLNNKKD